MTSAPVASGPVRVGDGAGQSPCSGGRGDVEDLVDQCRNPEGYGEKQHHLHGHTEGDDRHPGRGHGGHSIQRRNGETGEEGDDGHSQPASPSTATTAVLLFGFSTAPMHPLLVLTAAEQTSAAAADRMIGFQAPRSVARSSHR
jgi:hypothetical protein